MPNPFRLRPLLSRITRRFYTPGKFYRIPFGPARGQYMQYQPSNNLDLQLGLHEPNTFELLRQVIKPGMIVVDIGANHGYFSVFLDKLVAPDGLVYAFEPIPTTFATLQETLRINETKHVIAHCQAVSNSDGPVTMHLSRTHYMASLDGDWAGGETIEVQAIQLDTFFEDKPQGPDFIKLDIEGGGAFALPGMRQVVAQYQPTLLLESHTAAEDLAIGAILAQNDYVVYRVGSNVPVTNLAANYQDPQGVWGTVVGVSKKQIPNLPEFAPEQFGRWRLGQRK